VISAPHRLVEHVEQRVLVDPEHPAEQIEVELAGDDSAGAERSARLVAESVDPPPDHLADALRKRELGQRPSQRPATIVSALRDGSGLHEVAEDLRDEERVAGRLPADLDGERPSLLVHVVTGHAFESTTTSS
jgi:hypothetical protein